MIARFLPHRLNPRTWFVSTPLSILSLERRARLPKLPVGRWRFLGLPLAIAGVALWGWSTTTLIRHSGGRPDSTDLPRHLVSEGPYAHSRNPMMIAALLTLGGGALTLRSPLLLLYVGGLAAALHRHIVRVEEPQLAGRFGSDYEAYARRVPRWLTRLADNGRTGTGSE